MTESEVGKGSTFTVTIDPGSPAMDELQKFIFAPVPPPVMPAGTSRLDGIRILVVEDNVDNQLLIKRHLQQAGAVVTLAANGKQALDFAEKQVFDMVLMDLQMPEMDGFTAASEMRRHGFDKPIIALTAHAMKEERRKCLDSGFSDHLSKPIDKIHLLQTISRHTG